VDFCATSIPGQKGEGVSSIGEGIIEGGVNIVDFIGPQGNRWGKQKDLTGKLGTGKLTKKEK